MISGGSGTITPTLADKGTLNTSQASASVTIDPNAVYSVSCARREAGQMFIEVVRIVDNGTVTDMNTESGDPTSVTVSGTTLTVSTSVPSIVTDYVVVKLTA